MDSKIKSIIYALFCVILWALIPIVSKLGQSNLDNHQFVFWSCLISFLTFLIIVLVKNEVRGILKLSLKNIVQAIVLGFLGTYLYYILLYFGYANARGIEVLVIQYCWPIFTLILSVLILKEKLNKRKIVSIILSFGGVFLVLTKGKLTELHFDNLFVDGVVLLAAFVFGLFSVLSKKIKIDSLTLVTIYFLTATVISFIVMIFLSEFILPPKETLLPILINGIFVNGISYIFWIEALKLSSASFLASFIFLTPVIALILLILFFNEPFQLIYVLGMVAVISGGLINKD